jgi:hypothetical protein
LGGEEKGRESNRKAMHGSLLKLGNKYERVGYFILPASEYVKNFP